MKYLLISFMLLTIYSCRSPDDRKDQVEVPKNTSPVQQPTTLEKKEDLAVNTTREEPVVETNVKTNDGFRNKVVSSMTNSNDIEVFNRVLDKLDRKELYVCDVIGQLFTIDDRSLANAKRQFPNPSQQESFSKVYSSGIKQGYEKYARSINLSMDEIRFLNTAYAFHQPVKSFCGNF